MSRDPRTSEAGRAAGESLLGRWGRLVAHLRWAFLLGWAVLLTAAAVLYPQYQEHQTALSYSVQGSESARADALVAEEFPDLGAEQDVIVFQAVGTTVRTPATRAVIADSLRDVEGRAGVERVVPPFGPGADSQVSADGTVAIAPVSLSGDVGAAADRVERSLDENASDHRVRTYLVGNTPITNAILDQEYVSAETAEMIGIPVAFVILVLATGSLTASLLPLAFGIVAVFLAFGVLGGISYATSLDGILTTVVPMIGLGVGIDYTLFIVARFREELAQSTRPGRLPGRATVRDAIAVAVSRSGKTIAFSGVVVMCSLLSLTVLRAQTFQQLGWGMSLAVGCALLAGLTLLPAVLAVLGHRVERGSLPWRRRVVVVASNEGRGVFGRLARTLMRHPIVATVAAFMVLLVLAVPMTGMRLGIDLGVDGLDDSEAAAGQRVLAETFSPGLLMPTNIVYTAGGDRLTNRDLANVDDLTAALRNDPQVSDVASVTTVADDSAAEQHPESALRNSPLVGEDGRHTYLSVVPAVPPDSTSATALVERIRDDIAPRSSPGDVEILVGGQTAQFVDIEQETDDKLWLVVVLVLGLSFLFLMISFRSLVLPLKAIAMNLLAYGAAFGAVVWIFQDGHLEGVFDFQSTGVVQVYLPLIMFAMLFGLSMDYEIFLVRRIQETWQRTGDNERSVAVGLEHTALPISAAAAIMVAVFGAFITADIVEMKQIGFGFAFAVLIDATLIRIILVPAVMRLAGRFNWWLPQPLGRILPRLELD